MGGEDTRDPGVLSGSKRGNNSEYSTDRISDLQDELLDCILGRLSMCDVVKTSVLSKRWSFCWTRHGKLDFGPEFVEKYIKGKNEHRLVKIVDSILLKQINPVLKFELHLRGLHLKFWTIHLDRWIIFLSGHGIRDLNICGHGRYFTKLNDAIFKCSGLQNLELAFCEVGPSEGFNGFPDLRNLEIISCHIPKTEWEKMIDSPSLQTLRVHWPYAGDPIKVGGPHIKSLIVDFDESQPVYLKESPKLIDATIRTMLVLPENHEETSELNQFVGLLPNVKTLILAGLTLDSLACDTLPLRLPTMLTNLEHLELHYIDILSMMELSCLFCLIRSSPNLQSLVISLICESDIDKEEEVALEDFLTAQRTEGVMSGIRTLALIDLEGTKYEVDFIKTIIECCPKLGSIKVGACPRYDPYEKWFLAALRSLHGSINFETDYYTASTNA